MAKDSHNPELAVPTTISREVLVSVQNSANTVLTLTNFSLTNGYWDPSTTPPQLGIPSQGYQVQVASTPVWGNYSPTPFTGVGGTMLFFANASTVTVTWQWVYGSEPTANVTVSGSALKASVVLANSTGTQITAQVQIQGNA